MNIPRCPMLDCLDSGMITYDVCHVGMCIRHIIIKETPEWNSFYCPECTRKQATTMDNEQVRNEQFKGFAYLLFNELYERGLIARPDIRVYRDNFNGAVKWQNQVRQHTEQIIAQRAYDLMEHIMLYAPAVPVPDMTKWPTPQEP